MTRLQKFANFTKLEHSLFSLPLLFAGAFLAEKKWPSWRLTLLIVVAGVAARVLAMSLNRIIDLPFDKDNPRTQSRVLATGQMSLIEAWGTVAISSLLYGLTAWAISSLCLKLAWVPVLGFVVYPYLKRLTKWAHVGLGLVWAIVPVAGFVAVGASLDNAGPVVFISIFCVFWLAGFDIIYATQDEDFDRYRGLYSLPAAWGSKKALRLAALFHAIGFFLLFVLYFVFFSGVATVMILGVIGLFLILEQYSSANITFSFFYLNVAVSVMVLFFVIAGANGL